MKALVVIKQRSVKKLSMEPTAREFSAFQANSIKDSKTLLIMKPGSVRKPSMQITARGGHETTQSTKKSDCMLSQPIKNKLQYWWSKNNAVGKKR